MRSLCLALPLLVSAAAAQTPVRVAYLYNSWPKGQASFKDEFDGAFKALGWSAVKFENVQAADLTSRLDEFDVVVGGGVSNLDHAVDFAPLAEAWRGFLDGGGVVIATDASYGGINQQWIGAIDPALKTSSATCAAHREPSPETEAVTFAEADPLLNLPHRLGPELAAKTCWAHLANVGEGWRTAVSCYDHQPLLLHRRYGRGLVVVTSYFRFQGGDAGRHLLENAWTLASLQRQGLAIDAVRVPAEPRRGPNPFGLTVTNLDEATTASLAIEARCEGATAAGTTTVTLPAGETRQLDLRLDLPLRGDYATTLTLLRGETPLLTLHPPLVVPELLTASLARRHLFGPHATARVELRLAPELRQELGQLRVTLSGRGLPTVDVTPDSLDLERSIGLPELPAGQHDLRATLTRGAEDLKVVTLPFELHVDRRVWFDEQNVCHIGDEPFFPIGMYHVAWRATPEQMLQCVDDLAAMGCNTVHTSCTDLDVFQRVLDHAAERGMMVIAEGVARRPEAIQRFRNHPAILAWNSGDEPDVHNVVPATVGQHIDEVLDLDPDHPLYTTVANPAVLHRYAPYADVFSNDPYPVRKPDADTIAVAKQTATARASVGRRRPLWMVPQCFGYPGGTWAIPTPAQLRSMTYQTVIEGANGVIWYVYDDVKFKLNDHPELVAMVRQLAGELTVLTPAFLGPAYDAARFQSGPDGCIRACAIREGKTLTILAAHTNATDLGPQTLAVPGLAGDTAEVMFENRTVAVADGGLTDAFGPYGVHVYRVVTR